MYREITNPDDHIILQQDLQALAEFSRTWLMEFTIKKCAILSITHKKQPSKYPYTIFGELLGRVDHHDYLGVTNSNDLSCNNHSQQVMRKSNQTLGLLRRTLAPCNRDVKTKAYESLVRPRLEYAAEVWNPHSTTIVDRLEQVQRAVERFVYADYRRTTSVRHLLNEIGWDSFHIRRLTAQSVMFFKIYHQLVNISLPPSFQPATYATYQGTTICTNTTF